jgi:hypothetical protein
MRAMFRKALLTVLLVSVAGIACDDDDTPRPRDGGTDARRDGGTDARDGAAADRTPDVGTVDGPTPDGGTPDRTPDTAVDRVSDTPVTPDAPPDVSPTPDTQLPDTNSTPDTQPMPDAPDAALMPDTMPDTAMPDAAEPDATPDTAIPDTNPPDAQTFTALNGCQDVSQFLADPDPSDPLFIPWADIYQSDRPICFRIEAGDQVAWQVGKLVSHTTETFADHPLESTEVGSPIAGKSTADQTDYVVTFPTPGTFGFHCTMHPNMKGAIWVVPAIP